MGLARGLCCWMLPYCKSHQARLLRLAELLKARLPFLILRLPLLQNGNSVLQPFPPFCNLIGICRIQNICQLIDQRQPLSLIASASDPFQTEGGIRFTNTPATSHGLGVFSSKATTCGDHFHLLPSPPTAIAGTTLTT